MPIYIYENGHGLRLEALRPMEDRDDCPEGFKRVMPDSISVVGLNNHRQSQAHQVLEGYRKVEQTAGLNEIEKYGFTAEQVKKIWSEPDNDTAYDDALKRAEDKHASQPEPA